MIVNPLDALENAPCTLCALLLPYHINNAWAVKVFYKSICAFASREQFEKCQQQILDFAYELLIDIRKEASMSNVVQQS